ncbi:extracellular solute-binding protein [Vallitalea sp.]|jgi:iron(III) transport system substrate-binding protein|uniref:extracellular solute-binding protein n=1 Tax=Vallitalea sp. TaxID=1882829 RepID=UPI0025EB9107|nr:extracellular solute-binding protein [Vallitalea sp.]MCT4686898.1 extracellular solute-binding protein [Vallitalea sp.]
MKKQQFFLVILIFVLILVGCGSKTSNSVKDDEIPKPQEKEKIETTKSEDKVELVIYTNQIDGDREELFKILVEEQNFNFDVVFVQSGGGDIRDRLIAEKNNPIADVVLGASTLEHLALVENDLLVPFTPDWSDTVDTSLVGVDNKFWPWAIDTFHFTYNTALIGGEGQLPVPNDWYDLTSPEYKGKYYVFGSTGTTGGVMFASMLVRHRDDNGILGVSEEGWKLIEDIHANAINPFPNDFREALKGEVVGGFIWGGGVVTIPESKGIELDVMETPVGTPFLPANIAIINTGKQNKMKYAEEFVNWWGSKEVQTKWGGAFGNAPANKEALDAIGGELKAFMERLSVHDIDWQFVYEHFSTFFSGFRI